MYLHSPTEFTISTWHFQKCDGVNSFKIGYKPMILPLTKNKDLYPTYNSFNLMTRYSIHWVCIQNLICDMYNFFWFIYLGKIFTRRSNHILFSYNQFEWNWNLACNWILILKKQWKKLCVKKKKKNTHKMCLITSNKFL